MNDHPTLEHGFILNELAHLAEKVDTTTEQGNAAMLFALTERFGVELGLAVKRGGMTEAELIPFLENTVMIASLVCGEVVNDTYGLMDSGRKVH